MVAVYCLLRNSFRILIVAVNGDSRQNEFLCMGSWHGGMGMGLEVLSGSKVGRKPRWSTRIYLVPWEWGERVSRVCHRLSATELGVRLGDWRNWTIFEDLQSGYLLPWLEWPMGSHWMPSGIGGWDKVMCEKWGGGSLEGRYVWALGDYVRWVGIMTNDKVLQKIHNI